MEAEGCIIPDVNNVKNIRKGHQGEDRESKDTNHGRKRVLMLAEDDYGEILKKKLHKNVHSAK